MRRSGLGSMRRCCGDTTRGQTCRGPAPSPSHPRLWGETTADIPTFYEMKAEDLPPFGTKQRGRFLCPGKNSNILSAGVTE